MSVCNKNSYPRVRHCIGGRVVPVHNRYLHRVLYKPPLVIIDLRAHLELKELNPNYSMWKMSITLLLKRFTHTIAVQKNWAVISCLLWEFSGKPAIFAKEHFIINFGVLGGGVKSFLSEWAKNRQLKYRNCLLHVHPLILAKYRHSSVARASSSRSRS